LLDSLLKRYHGSDIVFVGYIQLDTLSG